MSPKRAALPGKDALFGEARREIPAPEPELRSPAEVSQNLARKRKVWDTFGPEGPQTDEEILAFIQEVAPRRAPEAEVEAEKEAPAQTQAWKPVVPGAPPETEAAVGAPPAAEKRKGTVQLCVWVMPPVAAEVDRARARLLMEHGLKVTKSQIVTALLVPGLTDMELLVERLTAE